MAGLLKGCKTFYDSFNENNFLLAGNYYQKYVSKSYGMTYTGESGTMRTFDIPNTANVDSAVYDPRTERIYFFVGSTVRKVKLAIIHSYLSIYSVPLFQKYCVFLPPGNTGPSNQVSFGVTPTPPITSTGNLNDNILFLLSNRCMKFNQNTTPRGM